MKHLFDKDEVSIDLTSLLDVIFIVLLIVMCNQKFMVEDAQSKTDQAQEMMAQANQTQTAYEQHVEKYEETDNYVLFVDVTSTYDPADRTNRTVTIMVGAGEDAKPYKLEVNKENDTDQFAKVADYILEYIEAYASEQPQTLRPVILTVNKEDDDILYRDECAIEDIFKRLQDKYDYVYIR